MRVRYPKLADVETRRVLPGGYPNWVGALLLTSLSAGVGCGSDASSASGLGQGPNGASPADGSGVIVGGEALAPSDGTGAGPVFDVGAVPGGLGGGGLGGGEVCDGLDNDGNGVTDDVDLGGDGVCDCLNIATIGEIGPWSDGGNLFAAWLNARSPLGAVALGNQVLTDDLLRPFQVIVVLYAATSQLDANGRMLLPHHEFAAEETAVFQRWVEAGGGVMTTVGYLGDEVAEVANVNRLLGPFGVGYSSTNLNLDGFVPSWQPHRVTSGILNIFTANGVEPSGAGSALASDANGRLALEVAEPGLGHVVVWGDEWITYDSQWQDVEDQQVERLWLNILSWLSPAAECQVPIPPSVR